MKSILFFTQSLSLLKHWEKVLDNIYLPTYFKDFLDLEQYLEKNSEKTILMVDESNINDIFDFLSQLERFDFLKILVFNSIPQVYHAAKVIGKNNVKGYENAYLHKTNLINMLTNIEDGKKWLFPELTNHIINRFIQDTETKEPDFVQFLTPKEKEISYLIADGLTNKEIAIKERIALSTVKNHIKKIFEKASVTDRVSLALLFK